MFMVMQKKRVAAVENRPKLKMSSIGQYILMAFTVTVNKFASSNVQAVHRRRTHPPNTTSNATDANGRRGLLLSTLFAASQLTEDDARTQLLKSS